VYGSISRLLRLAAPLLAAVAIVGYLVGHSHSSATPAGAAEKTRIAYGTSVLLEYPGSWRLTDAGSAPAIPGLPVAGAMLLTPRGNGARAGLLSGQIPGGGTSPLPGGLLAQLRGTPHTEVVDLLDAQAYRYSQLSLQSYDRILYLYVIPSPGSSNAALACYATSAESGALRQCQQIVAGLTLVGRSPSDLTPEAGYASHLKQLIDTLDKQRLTLRATMRATAAPSALRRLAATLASRFAVAAKALTVLEPPLPAGAAQAALASSMLRAQHAYDALAAAARAEDPARYAGAKARVEAAETGVDAALQTFALLGYSPS
jgi:hypothetical protein